MVNLIYQAFHRIGMEPPSVNQLLNWCKDDPKPWDLYKRGCTLCLNQVEKPGTSARVGVYHPSNISELCAFVAAIRPGFKSMYKIFESRKPFAYGVKAFDDMIQTEDMPNSFVLYQEQEMEALHYAGIPMSDCYTAIKNIAKKRKEKVLAYEEVFKKGFNKTMIEDEHKTPEQAERLSSQLWQIITDAANYSFNCLSGDTIIQKTGGKNGRFQPTIEEMYMIMNFPEYAKATHHKSLRNKYLMNGYGSALSMFDDKRIYKNQIIGIYPAGKQLTYLVKTKTGKSIKCTMGHSFPTPDGKKTLSELSIGDYLYCKGDYEVCREKYPYTNGNFESNVPHKGQTEFQKKDNGGYVLFQAAEVQHKERQDCCSICGKPYSGNERFELHHIDMDRTNNSPDNLLWLCCSCHKKEHYKNGRRKIYEKGIPTYLDEITEITPLKVERTYDVEMADPAHTVISENGLVASNCSHAYCVALDSLYEAWLKANYPYEFYEVALTIYEKKGNKDKMNALKNEAENYFSIRFPSFRYGQDNRSIRADPDHNIISNSLASIKGFGKSMCNTLYECSQQGFTDFYDILRWLDTKSIKSAKVIPLIKIDYFQEFGNNVELLRLVNIFDFLKQGTAKSVKKDKLDPTSEEFIKRHGNDQGVHGNILKSYTITDMDGLLKDIEQYIFGLHLPEMSYRVKAQNQKEVLGFVDLTTCKEEDRRKLYILKVYALPNKWGKAGGVWKYKVNTKSVGSGKTSSLSLDPKLMERFPIKENDIIYAHSVAKDRKGYWNLLKYELIL